MANATMILIASQVLGSTASSVTFSSIPQTYTDLKLICSVRTDIAAVTDGPFWVTFNGDNGSNYSITSIAAQGTSLSPYQFANQTKSRTTVEGLDSGTNTANTFSSLEMYIPNYTQTNSRPFMAFNVTEQNASGSNWIDFDANLYRGTSAISSINISANTQNYVQYSTFYLYGIKNS